MSSVDRAANYLLRTMADDDFARLEPSLMPMELAKTEDLLAPDAPIRFTWFPVSGIVSVVAETASGSQAEVAVVGREGMLSVSTLLGVDHEIMHIFCQMPCRAYQLPAMTMRALLDDSPTLRRHLLRYAQSFLLQTANSALAYATQTIEVRLARWLVMSLDRLDNSEVAMTHEAFALMLGVRRPGVTVAIQALEARGAVISRRGTIVVVDHSLLVDIAGDCYGVTEDAYRRVIGVALRRPRLTPYVDEAGAV